MEKLEKLRWKYNDEEAWGLLTSVDLKNCDGKKIRDKKMITRYVKNLCEIIDMKPYGQPKVVHFGEDEKVEGFSLVQLIETSLISGHFANITNTAYIDIFSCKFYDPYAAAEYTREFFNADSFKIKTLLRK